jgi:hypothetical protein
MPIEACLPLLLLEDMPSDSGAAGESEKIIQMPYLQRLFGIVGREPEARSGNRGGSLRPPIQIQDQGIALPGRCLLRL